MRCYDTNTTIFEVAKDPKLYGKKMSQSMRTIKYNFGPDFFKLHRIGALIKFRVGDKPLNKLTLV